MDAGGRATQGAVAEAGIQKNCTDGWVYSHYQRTYYIDRSGTKYS